MISEGVEFLEMRVQQTIELIERLRQENGNLRNEIVGLHNEVQRLKGEIDTLKEEKTGLQDKIDRMRFSS